jgi:hypothetical protein
MKPSTYSLLKAAALVDVRQARLQSLVDQAVGDLYISE